MTTAENSDIDPFVWDRGTETLSDTVVARLRELRSLTAIGRYKNGVPSDADIAAISADWFLPDQEPQGGALNTTMLREFINYLTLEMSALTDAVLAIASEIDRQVAE
jgi:hypothetical protein